MDRKVLSPASRLSDPGRLSPHLQRLEDESLFIIREFAAEFRRPVMLYSVGKDSSVMLHLARIESAAADVAGIVEEVMRSRVSERQGRLVDAALQASIERKKREGYF